MPKGFTEMSEVLLHFGAWSLVLLWMPDVGIWNFFRHKSFQLFSRGGLFWNGGIFDDQCSIHRRMKLLRGALGRTVKDELPGPIGSKIDSFLSADPRPIPEQ